jgi:hypothetical protein
LGNPAAVRGLKFDQESDTFTAWCVYKLFQKESNKVEEIEEILVVSEEWVKLAGFAKGVVEHGCHHTYGQWMWICPCARRGQNSDEHQEGTESKICAPHCTFGF